jgi:diguanylate cyclase (GGDEF)-like protein/PAS domain S-box-containing protein
LTTSPDPDGPQILCVEDDAASRTVLVQILRQRFANLIVAKGGVEGLDLFRRYRPALVVTDIAMPDMDGIAMARTIKQECPETKVIFTTARGDSDLLLTAIELGVSDYVIKPLSAQRLHSAVGKCLEVVALERELRNSHARTEVILESIGDAFFVLDRHGLFTYLNRRAEEYFRVPRQGLLGQSLLTRFPEFFPHQQVFLDARAAQESQSFEHFSPEHECWIEARVFPLEGGISVYLRDITEKKLAEEKVCQLAFYDKLTGLPNRVLLQDRLTSAMARTRRNGEACALLFIDLDFFKNINDTLGHAAGDLVLKEMADRLHASIRDSDTAARLGGDEFVVLLEGFEHPENIHSVTHRILLSLAQEIHLQGVSLSLTASIGISFFPEDGETAEALLKAADTAMYHGKKRGRNTYQFYRKEMNAQTQQFLLLDSALRLAVQRNEFLLYYQPQYHLQTQALIGFEALVRWRHPERGILSPCDFLPLAEDTGFILDLGEWVLEQACRQARRWLDLNPGPLRVGVNLSSRQFWQEDLVANLGRVLAETGLPPHCLELEIKESVVMTDVDTVVARMRKITDLGVRLAIDDFGTGYSSLAVLGRFPLHSLKIDRSFIAMLASNPGDAAIVTTIISLAHKLNLSVVAEGIETQEQLDFLIREGCEAGQGYLFSPPIPEAQVKAEFMQADEV